MVLLAVAVLVVGGFLPTLTAHVQDARSQGIPVYENVDVIELKLGEREQESAEKAIGFLGKLSLLQDGEALEVGGNDVSMTYEGAEDAFRKGLQVYQEAAMLPQDLSGMVFSGTPLLYYSAMNPEFNHVFWEVHFEGEVDSGGCGMMAIMDDETGEILTINVYLDYEAWGGNPYEDSEESFRYILDTFRMHYLSRYPELFGETFRAGRSVGLGYMTETYTWGDSVYGEISMVFEASGGGFSVSLPSESYGSNTGC